MILRILTLVASLVTGPPADAQSALTEEQGHEDLDETQHGERAYNL